MHDSNQFNWRFRSIPMNKTTTFVETDFSFSGWTKYYFPDPIVFDLVGKCTLIWVALNQSFDFENRFLINKSSIIDLL